MKISVIIATWERHQLLIQRAIPSVLAQTVEVECVVACDGPDLHLRDLVAEMPVVYTEVPVHNEHQTNVGGWARNQGLDVATGDLIAYLDDDNAFRPNHIEVLAAALEANPTADFAYSRMERHGLGDVVGSYPAAFGCIDSSLIMHRADTHCKFGCWPTPSEYAIDWQLIEMWLNAGAKYEFVPEITVDYYAKGGP